MKRKESESWKDDCVPCTVKVPVMPCSEEERENAINAVKLWRAICTQGSAGLAALDLVTGCVDVGKDGLVLLEPAAWKNLGPVLKEVWGYESSSGALDRFVGRLAPSWLSSTVQLASREIAKRWGAKDPDKQVSRRFLTFQSERRPAVFVNAPLQLLFAPTANPAVEFHLDKHRLGLRWDKSIGFVNFRIFDLDPRRWSVLKGLANGTLPPAGCKLQMLWTDKGPRFEVRMGYWMRAKPREADPARVLEVAFGEDPETFMVHRLRSGHRPAAGLPLDEVRAFTVSARACLAQLDRVRSQSEGLEAERKSAGRVWSVRHGIREREARLTRRRDGIVKDWCHVWSRMAVASARRMECGRIDVIGMPAQLFARPFQWSTFRFDLAYKAKLAGLEVRFDAGVEPKAEDVLSAE